MSISLGVDSSTQSTKVEARRIDTGTIVGTGRGAHPPTSPPVSEQDPDAWWAALVDACGQLDPAVRADVSAIAVGGQQHGLVLLDDAGAILRPAKLWNDTESAPQADELVAALGTEAWAAACGSVPVAAFTITKLAWVAQNEPDVVSRAARALLPHDWLTWRLCDRFVTDRGDASGSGWFDPRTGDYRPDLLALIDGVGADFVDCLPEVLGPFEPAGTLTTAAAEALGLPAGIAIGPGTGDNMAAALGLGLAPGDLAMSLGTSGTIYAVSATPAADPSGAVAGFADASGHFLPLVCTLNATKVTDTVAGWLGFGGDPAGFAALAGEVDPAASTPILVPYFDGERTPNLPDASGAFAGLRNDTTRAELARAAHDGVLCGLFAGVDALVAAGVGASGTLHLIGGGARSAAYRQRAADLRGASIVVPDADETVATGAAAQAAAVATGSSIADLTSAWGLGAGTTVEPDPRADGDAVRAEYARVAVDPTFC